MLALALVTRAIAYMAIDRWLHKENVDWVVVVDGVLWDGQQDSNLLLTIVSWVLMAFRKPYLVSDLFCFMEKAIRQEAKRLPTVWGQEVSSAFIIDLHNSVKSQVGWGWGHGRLYSGAQVLAWNLGPYACWASSVPPSHTPRSPLTSLAAEQLLLARVGQAFPVRTVCVLSHKPPPLNCHYLLFCHSDEKSNQLTELAQVCVS